MWPEVFQQGLFQTAKQAMQASWQSHQEATHNLNNYDTPGFRAQNTDFRSLLLASDGEPPKGDAFRAYLEDVNPSQPVNVDRELARLAECSMETDAYTRILNKQYSSLRQAISEGKR
jgi:flagellar basal body rod protein FlgB